MDENKMRKSQNTLGLLGVIVMGVLLLLFMLSGAVLIICNSVALYGSNSGFFNPYSVLYYFLIDFYPILLIGDMFVVYNSFCKSYNTKHLIASTVLGFVSASVYAISFIPLSILDSPLIARDVCALDSENYFGWFNITMLVLMLVIVFICYVQIAFLLYFSKVRKRINYTQIMHRYEHFRFAMLAVFVLYLAMFVCYMIILGGRI